MLVREMELKQMLLKKIHVLVIVKLAMEVQNGGYLI